MKPTKITPSSPVSADLLVVPPTRISGEQIEFSCRLAEPGRLTRTIWFRFPSADEPLLTRQADPFVIATLTYAMGRFDRLRVHGAVSEGLVQNLSDFQNAFAAFRRGAGYRPVEIVADYTQPAASPRREPLGITAFSGGVDSCFSVYRNTRLSKLTPKRLIGATLMMHGFDIPLDQPEVFADSVKRARALTDDAGLQLFTAETNLRTLSVPWLDTFATAVAASLSFFQESHAFGLVPSFQEWDRARMDHGSNPLTDPLLSSWTFPIIHDGASFGRIDKLRHLSHWPTAIRNLRVCWQGQRLDRNCCRCEKCVRTMLMFRLCGVTHAEAFPHDLTPREIERMIIRSQSGLDEFEYLLEEAQRAGIDEPWTRATARMVRRSRRCQRLWQRGQALANVIPDGVRDTLRDLGHRWLWRSRPTERPAAPEPTVVTASHAGAR